MKVFRVGVFLFIVLYWVGMSILWLRFFENNYGVIEGFIPNLLVVIASSIVAFPIILGSFTSILSFILLPNGFEYFVKGHWYSGAWYINGRADGLLPKEGELAFNYRDSHMVNGLAPAYILGDKVGLYKIVSGPYRKTGSGGNDRAGWDDSNYVDLRLVDIRPLDEIETILKNQVS